MAWEKNARAFAVVETREGEPLILLVHRRPKCERLKAEMGDPEMDRYRDIVWHPDRIEDILVGKFHPGRGTKELIDLRATGEESEFLDRLGRRHLIPSCPGCAIDPPTKMNRKYTSR